MPVIFVATMPCIVIILISWVWCNNYIKQEKKKDTVQFKKAIGKSDIWITKGIHVTPYVGIFLLRMMHQVFINKEKSSQDYYFLVAGVLNLFSICLLIALYLSIFLH